VAGTDQEHHHHEAAARPRLAVGFVVFKQKLRQQIKCIQNFYGFYVKIISTLTEKTDFSLYSLIKL